MKSPKNWKLRLFFTYRHKSHRAFEIVVIQKYSGCMYLLNFWDLPVQILYVKEINTKDKSSWLSNIPKNKQPFKCKLSTWIEPGFLWSLFSFLSTMSFSCLKYLFAHKKSTPWLHVNLSENYLSQNIGQMETKEKQHR